MSVHVYLSTACLHELHDYCSSSEGQDGPKEPKRCKWCPSLCLCECHEPRLIVASQHSPGA